jgi:putative flippase GtrA
MDDESRRMKDLLIKYRRVILFALIGCVNTATDFLAATLAHEWLALPAGVCQTIGYCFGLCCSFILNRRFTFRDGERRLWGQMILFILVNLTTLGISVVCIGLLTGAGVNFYIAKVLITGLVMVCNYFGYKLLGFRVE